MEGLSKKEQRIYEGRWWREGGKGRLLLGETFWKIISKFKEQKCVGYVIGSSSPAMKKNYINPATIEDDYE